MSLSDIVTSLRCPKCHGKLEGDTLFHCPVCSVDYVVEDGVPRFCRESDLGFDERWRKHPAPQPTTIEQWVSKTNIPLSELSGKVILDAGCGIGRYCKFIGDYGAQVVGVDISWSGLSAARGNAPGAALIQGDLLNIPLNDDCVDAAFSIGVLHHLPDPAAGFREVARLVRPGGKLAVWVYSGVQPEFDTKWQLYNDFLHEVTRSLPPDVLYEIVSRYAVPIRDAYQPEWNALHQLMRPAYNPSDEQCISDMFDWHAPTYRFYHTYDEVKGWFDACGFNVSWCGDFPVSVTGIKR